MKGINGIYATNNISEDMLYNNYSFNNCNDNMREYWWNPIKWVKKAANDVADWTTGAANDVADWTVDTGKKIGDGIAKGAETVYEEALKPAGEAIYKGGKLVVSTGTSWVEPETWCKDNWEKIIRNMSNSINEYNKVVYNYDVIFDNYNTEIDNFNNMVNEYNNYVEKIHNIQEIINQFSKDSMKLADIQIPTYNKMATKNELQKTEYTNGKYETTNIDYPCKVYKTKHYYKTVHFDPSKNGFPDASYKFTFDINISPKYVVDIDSHIDDAITEVKNITNKIIILMTKIKTDIITFRAKEIKEMKASLNDIRNKFNTIKIMIMNTTKEDMEDAKINI